MGQCEISYLADNPNEQVIIRGIALPRGKGSTDARIVFVLTDKKSTPGNLHRF
jgi:hypothetical protein